MAHPDLGREGAGVEGAWAGLETHVHVCVYVCVCHVCVCLCMFWGVGVCVHVCAYRYMTCVCVGVCVHVCACRYMCGEGMPQFAYDTAISASGVNDRHKSYRNASIKYINTHINTYLFYLHQYILVLF